MEEQNKKLESQIFFETLIIKVNKINSRDGRSKNRQKKWNLHLKTIYLTITNKNMGNRFRTKNNKKLDLVQ